MEQISPDQNQGHKPRQKTNGIIRRFYQKDYCKDCRRYKIQNIEYYLESPKKAFYAYIFFHHKNSNQSDMPQTNPDSITQNRKGLFPHRECAAIHRLSVQIYARLSREGDNPPTATHG